MWASKGYVRSLGLIMLMIGNALAGNGLDLSSLPNILESLGMGVGLLGLINAVMGGKK